MTRETLGDAINYVKDGEGHDKGVCVVEDDDEYIFLPTRDLPRLSRRRQPSLSAIRAGLDALSGALGLHLSAAEHYVVDSLPKIVECTRYNLFSSSSSTCARTIGQSSSDEEKEEPAATEDAFELRYAKDWLLGLISQCSMGQVGEEEGDDDEEEEVVEALLARASQLLGFLAGKSASGAHSRVYHFPVSNSATAAATENDEECKKLGMKGEAIEDGQREEDDEGLVVQVRTTESTLKEDALGNRTWGSAPLLVQHLLPRFLSLLSRYRLETKSRSGPREGGRQKRTIRVLELGAGTGLVGLALADLARRSWRSDEDLEIEVHLTDFHPDVLENLQQNVDANGWNATSKNTETRSERSEEVSRGVKVLVSCVDWRTVYEGKQTAISGLQFDFIVAADCSYESLHTKWIHAVAMQHLAQPLGYATELESCCPDAITGALHMLVPHRPTHLQELNSIDLVFSHSKTSEENEDKEQRQAHERAEGPTGTTTALCIAHKDEMMGFDDFGPPKLLLHRSHHQRQHKHSRTASQEIPFARRLSGTSTRFSRYEIRWSARTS